MGAFTNFLKICGFWFPDKGTVFGGPEGDGIPGKIVLIVPLPPPKPPVPGHYPTRIEGNYQEYSGVRNLEPYRTRFAYQY